MGPNRQQLRTNRSNTAKFCRPGHARARTAMISAVGSAFPQASYSQDEIGVLLGLENEVVQKLLRAPHIRKRHLYLPAQDARTGRVFPETAYDLHAKFRHGALELGAG